MREYFDLFFAGKIYTLFASKIPWLTGNTRITKSQFIFKQKQKQRLFEFTTSCLNHDKNAAIFSSTDIVELKECIVT